MADQGKKRLGALSGFEAGNTSESTTHIQEHLANLFRRAIKIRRLSHGHLLFAEALAAEFDLKTMIGNKVYDSDRFIAALEMRSITAVIRQSLIGRPNLNETSYSTTNAISSNTSSIQSNTSRDRNTRRENRSKPLRRHPFGMGHSFVQMKTVSKLLEEIFLFDLKMAVKTYYIIIFLKISYAKERASFAVPLLPLIKSVLESGNLSQV